MSKKDKRRRSRAKASLAAGAPPRDLGAAIAAASLVAVLVCAGLLVDTGAEASFDAPKRLITLAGVALASAAAFGFSAWQNPFREAASRGAGQARRTVLWLCVAALAGGLVSALLSARRTLSLDATRALFLYALLLPLGASRVVERKKGLLLATFLGVAGVNTLVSILQARGLYQPFPLLTQSSRESSGAFVGNVGYLALTLALAAIAALGVCLLASRPLLRLAAGGAALFYLAGLLVNQNLTSLTALATGTALLLLCLYGRRAVLPVVAALLTLSIAVATYRPMRERATAALAAARAGDWDRLLTYRLGPWKAAIQMARERPFTGWGPGTFGAEFIPHRLKAEVSGRRRLINPLPTGTYAESHCDYLQPFAEAGVPVGLSVLAAVFLMFGSLYRATRSLDGRDRKEAIFLLALLGTGAAAALTWFPLQRPISAVPLLLAAGRAWRLSGLPARPSAEASSRGFEGPPGPPVTSLGHSPRPATQGGGQKGKRVRSGKRAP